MKIASIRLLQEPDKSFIVYKENKPFTEWHHHPEYELVLITKGRGKRMVGDHINRFKENDLVFLGSYTPHEWQCDPEYFSDDEVFKGEGIVIQFLEDFLGDKFFDVPENKNIKNFLKESSRGFEISGEAKIKIIALILKMIDMNTFERLYALFSIFKILASTSELKLLSSPVSMSTFGPNENDPMQKALKYILQNFQKPIHLKDLLEITNMSNTAFYAAFKHSYRMTYKNYLLTIRIGYACRLLTSGSMNISEIAYTCGFENLSNFNRQFKRIKCITPTQFEEQIIQKKVEQNSVPD